MENGMGGGNMHSIPISSRSIYESAKILQFGVLKMWTKKKQTTNSS